MTRPLATRTLRWVEDALEGRDVIEVQPIRVSSTAVHLVRAASRTGETKAILRRFVDRDRLNCDPWYVPQHEMTVLEALHSWSVPTPRLIAADPHAARCDSPSLLLSYLPGKPGGRLGSLRASTEIRQLATWLVEIHAVVPRDVDALRSYEPYRRLDEVDVPDWARLPSMWQQALELLEHGQPPQTTTRFVHRDYHPGNTLWDRRRGSGVIDWTTGCMGPPEIDVARMRHNLVLLDDAEMAKHFLDAYDRLAGSQAQHHPWWDLRDGLDMVVDVPPPQSPQGADALHRWEEFLAQTLAELT